MVIAYHVILSAYGFWSPNDPRGFWSDFVRSWELFRFGKATKVQTARSVAARPHNHRKRLAAKSALQYQPVRFTGVQARTIGRGFGEYVRRSDVAVWACTILPEHAHLVIARHRFAIEQVVNQLKGASTRSIIAEGLHPLARFAGTDERPPAMWAKRSWNVFLETEADIRRCIKYVKDNPLREGKPRQTWSFVAPYD